MRKGKIKKDFWENKKVVVTGGAGFLGKHLVKNLHKLSPQKVIVPKYPKYDLRKFEDCLKAFQGTDIIIHLAANVGGIGYNKSHPAELFDDNILISVNALRAAKQTGVQKFVGIGTVCSYPKYTPVPFKEENLWDGYPEETNAPYGLAKKMLIVQSMAYRTQYGFNSINILPVNLYGPGDNFNPKSSHVIPSLIRKFVEAKKNNRNEVVVWGSGKATREFIYVEDASKGILLACEKYNSSDPINLGSGFEISIKELALLISKIVGFKGRLSFDKTKPDGQPRRRLDISKARRKFGFRARTKFKSGLKKTVAWYLSQL
ncbi:GDP-fucose synthetase [Candidatus Curtissbacteria bacterium RIFCSPLOWO2_01_FULL_38_11b]|uniref:GDP-L-fucose synthase n=1 Tax=Candidatus Curtissbacteria bacterium RIFCSPLOWO2_01_FULL_38_11b TaxID=1797725 RepID=A0A1F5GZ13_9BACT|nr:MAG: GDP-fucose synthetase [Candidatus Curtissbacteria bacterium RIFCSPLOWO2_01_FULL_38_11b]